MSHSPALTPEARARHVREAMYANDAASQALGITIDDIGPGSATARMKVRAEMLNGFALCHGGYLTTLADTAFAFACNSYNEMTVASGLEVEFLKGVRLDEVLEARAVERSRNGRLGVYDVEVRNADGELVALVRGRSYRMQGRVIAPE